MGLIWHKVFFYDDTLPTELARTFQHRELYFEAAYIYDHLRCFRKFEESASGMASLIKKLNCFEYGFIVRLSEGELADLEKLYASKGYRRSRCSIGYGDGELGHAVTFKLPSDLSYQEPSYKTRRAIASWLTRFWPNDSGEPISPFEVGLR